MGQVNLPADLAQLVRDLQARVKALETAAQTRVPTDTISLGTLQVADPAGNVYTYIGAIIPPLTDGSPQYGFELYRQIGDQAVGSVALTLGNGSGNLPQTLGLYDFDGNTLWTDDGATGQGIGRPYISFPWAPNPTSLWASTTAGAWTNLWSAAPPKQHPKLYLAGGATTPVGVTGQLRLWDAVNNVQVGSTVTVNSGGGVLNWSIGPSPIGGNHMDGLLLELQGQITAGTGAIAAVIYSTYGQQT